MTTTAAAPSRPRRRYRVHALLGTVVAATTAWVILREVGGVDLTVAPGPVGLPAVVGATLVVGLAAWGLLTLLERRTRSGHRIWRIVAVTSLVLSLAGPIAMATTPAAAGGLITLHVVVGAALIRGLPTRC